MAVHKDHAPDLGVASGIATLNASTKVVQDPASAQAAAAASKIPISGANSQIAAGFRPWDPDFKSGLRVTWLATDQIQIETGKCRDSTDADNITVASAITPIDIDNNGANGLDTGSKAANTWYYVWVIKKSSDGTIGGLISLSSTSPTMPSGYDLRRRVGTIRSSASNTIVPFFQTGEGREIRIEANSALADLQILTGGTATSFTNISLTSFVPPTAERVLLNAQCNGTAGAVFRPDDATTMSGGQVIVGTSSRNTSISEIRCPGQIIEYGNSAGGGSTNAYAMGWIETV